MLLSSIIVRLRLLLPASLFRRLLGALSVSLIAASAPAQTTLYWDLNGATAGSGVTPTGTWDTSTANWSTSAAGTVATSVYTPASIAVFSAGTDATGSYTVTVSGTQNADSISVVSGSPTFTGGTITLSGATPTFSVASGLTATVNSVLDDGLTGTTKTGTGTLVLTGANTNLGGLLVNAGAVNLQNGLALGTSGAGAVVASGAALELQNNITITGETLQLSGSGIGGAGALRNISGSNTFAGPITVSADSQIGATAGTLALSGNIDLDAATTANTTLTFNPAAGSSITASGIISDSLNASFALNLAHIGSGTVTLSNGANNYYGNTTIGTAGGTTTGILALGANNALPTVNTASVITVYSGTLNLNNFNATASGALVLGGGGAGSSAAITTGTGTLTLGGNVTYDATNNPLGATISGKLALGTATRTFNVGNSSNAADDLAISAVVSGTGGLTKTGAGTLTLSGANTYAGKTTIQAGVLSVNTLANTSTVSALGAPTTVANGTIAIGAGATGATLLYTGAGSTTNRIINLAGTTGGATLDASGTGALVFSSALTATGTGSKTLTLTGSNTAANTLSGAIVNNSGTNTTSLVKSGAGTWVLAGNNTYTGTTAINGGTLRINADNRLGTAPGAATANKLTFDGGTLETTSTFTLNANRGTTINAGGGTIDVNPGTTLTYNGILAGTGTFTKADTGTLILGGATANTHTGDINVTGGTLQLAKTVANTAIGDAANVTVSSGATLAFSGGVGETIGSLAGGGTVNNTNAAAITLTTGGNNASTNFSGVIQNTGGNLSLTKTGTGTLALSGTTANTFAGNLNVAGGTVALGKTAGVNAFAGSTINLGDGIGAANSAVLRLDASNQIVNTAALVFASDGQLNLNGQTETVATVAGAGEILIGTGHLTAGDSSSTAFSGALIGTSGIFTKAGAGTLTLASTINYGGVFELAAGTLSLSGITANIGTLSITGNSTIDFSGASTLNVTNLSIAAGVTLNIINWTNVADYFFAQNWTGAAVDTTGAAPMNQVAFSGSPASSTKWQSYDRQVTPVPEPAAYGALLLGAMTAFIAWRRRPA